MLPEDSIRRILILVVLEDGDPAICTLALTCKQISDIESQQSFQEEAHFSWLDSVVNWRNTSDEHKGNYRRAYNMSMW
ncbi:hypothetical protein JOQ06_001771 [Pogonophryne albipinna]|uniref:F-box domain-containing protein n=1 Tax=Pogonophryne albipinna TaxID=1090488 RepID=A0AAD6B6Q1_9TELE|nr:hypothetical protein JOQ06_001771 [Pogonophryne albipinna]